MSSPPLNDYIVGLKCLIESRQKGNLTDEDELRMVEYLDDLWYGLSKEDHEVVYTKMAEWEASKKDN